MKITEIPYTNIYPIIINLETVFPFFRFFRLLTCTVKNVSNNQILIQLWNNNKIFMLGEKVYSRSPINFNSFRALVL